MRTRFESISLGVELGTLEVKGEWSDHYTTEAPLNSASDYDNLCALDVLGLADNVGADADVFNEFKGQLTRSKEGWFETTLPWRPTHIEKSGKPKFHGTDLFQTILANAGENGKVHHLFIVSTIVAYFS